jgi:hypothetical protein
MVVTHDPRTRIVFEAASQLPQKRASAGAVEPQNGEHRRARAGSNKRKQPSANTIERRDLLGGLIHEYRAAA